MSLRRYFMKMGRPCLRGVLGLVALVFGPSVVSGQSYSPGQWLGDVGGIRNWSDASNWEGGIIGGGVGTTNDTGDIQFYEAGEPVIVNVDAGRNVLDLLFFSGSYTIGLEEPMLGRHCISVRVGRSAWALKRDLHSGQLL
ncbi:hypothetical protein [Verrucomicrobium spinosum]|uniref:hypothetical protein n=1 Tax=Verrucomicrobium spinosum TaxID=2736 RepID=UPI0012E283D9|nr:hypothetical protein [Verrucomicrobium spinosum]